MNTQSAQLVDQQPSAIGNLQPSPLNEINYRYGPPAISGKYIGDTYHNLGPFGMPYWIQGIAMQTCDLFRINAPVAPQKSTMTHITRGIRNAGQAPVAQAPTKGIYTGVEGSC